MKLFNRKKTPRWFIEADPNPISNTIHLRIYRHGAPFSSATMTLTDECNDWEAEKLRFINMIKQIYIEGREE